MLKASCSRYDLIFKEPAVTSRSVMTHKETYFVKVWDETDPSTFGIGECGIFRGLSCDDTDDYEDTLKKACRKINEIKTGGFEMLRDYPSIVFGLETALLDLQNGGTRLIFDSPWAKGESAIVINGLVWMGDKQTMIRRVGEKLNVGFRCIKFKIGGIDFADELEMIRDVRRSFSPKDLEIRLDANGAFSPEEAMPRLETLSRFDIHSIEQPIKPRQWDSMAEICRRSPIPIALDEELIGLNVPAEKERMLETLRPSYIILKPSLCGGFIGSDEWVEIADEHGIGWWATSALESNIGLNAIAQWCSSKSIRMPQGLGTGLLYTNNIESPIAQTGQSLGYNEGRSWNIPEMQWTD